MEKSNMEFIKIEASKDKMLTDQNETMFVSNVYVPKDMQDVWHEVDKAYAERKLQEMRAKIEANSIKGETFRETLQERKCREIDQYSVSENVNCLTFSGQKTWLTPEIRANYKVSIEAARTLGQRDITFLVEGKEVTLNVDIVDGMLAKIQRYADECFLVAERHKRNVMKLKTEEQVDAYNYKEGFPQKLEF